VLRWLQAGSDPEQFDISSDGKQLFVANEDSGSTSVVDIVSGKTTAKIPVGLEPEGVVVSPDGRWILVTNESGNSVSMIDAATHRVAKSVVVGKRPRDLVYTADGKHAYVTGEFDASLYRIRVPEGEPIERVLQLRAEARPMTVLMNPSGNRLYVSTGRGGTVAVVDLGDAQSGAKVVTEIPVGTRPWGMALSPEGRWLYTANGPSNDVTVVDTSTLKVVKKIPVGQSPWGIVVGPGVNPEPPEHVQPAASRTKAATAPRLSLQIAEQFREFLGFFRVAKFAASFAGQRSVLGKGRGLDEVIVGQGLCDAIDGAGTLVQARKLAAALRDAFVDVFDAGLGGVIVFDRVGTERQGGRAQAQQCNERHYDSGSDSPVGSMA